MTPKINGLEVDNAELGKAVRLLWLWYSLLFQSTVLQTVLVDWKDWRSAAPRGDSSRPER